MRADLDRTGRALLIIWRGFCEVLRQSREEGLLRRRGGAGRQRRPGAPLFPVYCTMSEDRGWLRRRLRRAAESVIRGGLSMYYNEEEARAGSGLGRPRRRGTTSPVAGVLLLLGKKGLGLHDARPRKARRALRFTSVPRRLVGGRLRGARSGRPAGDSVSVLRVAGGLHLSYSWVLC